jgi:chemotaxis protein CheC
MSQNDQRGIWNQLIAPESRQMLHVVMRRAAGSLSQLSSSSFNVDATWIERIPLSEVMNQSGDPESEMVGVYLRMEDGLDGHALLIFSLEKACNIVDSLLGQAVGTTTSLESMEYSALAEIGNLTVSYFLNAMAELSDGSVMLRPTPPAVTVDMLGAILNTVVIPLAGMRDDLLIIGTTLKDASGSTQASIWMLPDHAYQDLRI